MAKKDSNEIINYLKDDLADIAFATDRGHLGEASRAVEPIIEALEKLNPNLLPRRISRVFKEQVETEIKQLRKAGLKRVIRITSAEFSSISEFSNDGFGFIRWVDDSRDWRECEIRAAVLERYIDLSTGECVIENFDPSAHITIRQSRHIRARDRSKNKFSMKDIYVREHYICPSCGAEHLQVADETQCPYCKAVINFHFFDWQLDSFYLDMHKQSLLGQAKDAVVTGASTAGVATAIGAIKLIEFLTNSWDRADEYSGENSGMNNQLGAILAVLFLIGYGIFAVFSRVPSFVRWIVGLGLVLFILWRVIRYLQDTEQDRKKKKIDRFSEGYLRSCVYNEVWKNIDTNYLIDFSLDDIILKSVRNTEETTTIDIAATVIRKSIDENRKIKINANDVTMHFSRARHPDKIMDDGVMMTEKECPSCGANFEPDQNHCCSYCGYGLKIENFVWRAVD